MNILLSNHSNLPIYEQIIEQIKTAIITKEISPLNPLPSIRALAKDLQISVITTKRAYEELEKEGLIYSVTGKGFYVCEQNTDFLKEQKRKRVESTLTTLIRDCQDAGLSKTDLLDMIEILYED